MTTAKDISTGKDKVIKWIGFDACNDSDIFEIDDLLKPSFDFWDKLETQCMAACCGIDAYSFWEEDIRNAIKGCDKPQLTSTLKYTKAEILQSNRTVVSSSRLNNLFHKHVFIQLIDHILRSIDGD
ncbi:hypothetical protein KK083_04140 [Fulvivirgaceae bacterium PWU4]|uniref:Uncharacterized protein n=1 Tax=Chryseosolibacter histidini TaxID=2782349 RepID=A0AAP2GHG8_9BACT|nr:DUF6331 family protein [Chryseosolibacter histidini]MBT1696054.1 hypothetical protein [Chryseosolibacter histidini]